MRGYGVLLGASLTAVTSGAMAQTIPSASTEQATRSDGRHDPDARDGGAGDIVVTAQRRSESLRDVPIAVTVIGGASLRTTGATQLPDITQRTPSLTYTPIPGTPSFSIRGVGTNSFDYSVESAVGLAIDDVNITLPRLNPLNALDDVERIEVLRGPQGLLFGKNTTAGLISVTTRKPQLGEYTNEGRVQYGSRNQLQMYDAINVPLGANAALRLRAGYQYAEPALRVRGPGSIADTRNYNVNGKLLWNVTDRLSIYAIGDHQDSRGDPGVWTIRSFGAGANAPAAGNAFVRTQLTSLGIVPGAENRDTGIGAANAARSRSTGGQATISYDVGAATITSVTAYRDVDAAYNLEVDSSPLPVYDNNLATLRGHQFSQELRVGSNGAATFDYIAGLYYFRQSLDAVNLQYGTFGFLPTAAPVRLSQTGGAVNFGIRSRSYAGFAQGTLHVTERLRLIVGGRYTRDEIDGAATITAVPGVCSLAFAATGGRVCQAVPLPRSAGASRNEDGWSGRAGVQYDVAERANIYFTASRGYKGPAISLINANVFQVEPETVDAYEVGLKADLLERRLSLNVAAFRNTFDDFQAQVFDPTVQPVGAFRTGNAGGLRTQGVEVEATARPARGLSLTGGVTFLDTEFTQYRPACYAGQTAALGCTLPGPTFDAKGLPLTNAPRWSTSLATAYETDISGELKMFVNADWSHRSSVYFGIGNPNTIQSGYSLVNGTIGIGDVGDHVKVSVFVRNLLDKRYAALIFPSYFDAGGYSQVLPDAAFRRIGGAVSWRF